MCKTQFLKYFSEESCKSCSSIQKSDKCLQFDECSSMEFEYFKAGYLEHQQECEEKLRWIPVEERIPEVSSDKNDWWTSDIGEVFPYSRKCIVVNDEGEFFINNYSIFENCWATFCGTVVKWRYL